MQEVLERILALQPSYMGHADIKTAMRYVHHVPKHDAAERFSRFVDEQMQASVVVSADDPIAA